MEKGESLTDWTQRAHPDLFQGIAVLVHVATRLRDMHAAGYVHRDIKPGNIMLLPRTNSWTVIDFGCTSRTGETAPLSFTVQYAPPEVIEAYQAKAKTIIATEAMDAWAMGVVAFELLTGGNAFSLVHGSKQVRYTSCPCKFCGLEPLLLDFR
jgi:serine/threonine protein kinase